MDFQKLKTFQTVAVLMNFNRAAEVLNYAQSSVSAQIKSLEEEVGVLFFKRGGKKVKLTPEGLKMLKYANKILSIGEEAMADLNKKSAEGVLTIRAPQTVATYYLPEILSRFNPLYPGVRFDITSCAFHNLENELGMGSVDLAFLITDSISSPHLNFKVVGHEKLLVVAPPEHPLSRGGLIGFEDLKGVNLLLPKSDCGYRMEFEKALSSHGRTSPLLMEFNSIEAIKNCVKLGLGITIIPQVAVAREIKKGELIILPWKEELETAILMIWHKERWISPALFAFLETI